MPDPPQNSNRGVWFVGADPSCIAVIVCGTAGTQCIFWQNQQMCIADYCASGRGLPAQQEELHGFRPGDLRLRITVTANLSTCLCLR